MGKKTQRVLKIVGTDNSFKTAVENTFAVQKGYRVGFQAIKNCDRKYYSAKNTKLLDGSVDIDKCTIDLYPDDARWDYAIGYNGKVHFSEVHPASTSNVQEILAKISWLEKWLKESAPHLYKLPVFSPKYSWIATDAGVHIEYPKTSKQYRYLVSKGLWPKRQMIFE